MTDGQSNHFMMFGVVSRVCADNAAIVATVPHMVVLVNKLNALINEISETAKVQETVTTGVATSKLKQKMTLARQATIVASMLKAYAKSQKDMVLYATVDYTYNKLMKFRDTIMPGHCRIILNEASARQAVLMAEYGMTVDILSDLAIAIAAYEAKIAAPKLAKIEQMEATARLKELIEETLGLLYNELDNSVEIYRDSEPHFYKLYHQARKIYDR